MSLKHVWIYVKKETDMGPVGVEYIMAVSGIEMSEIYNCHNFTLCCLSWKQNKYAKRWREEELEIYLVGERKKLKSIQKKREKGEKNDKARWWVYAWMETT